MKTAPRGGVERWTIEQSRKSARGREGLSKKWIVYPPFFRRHAYAPPNRRFDTWEQAADYVFEQIGRPRKQKLSTKLRYKYSYPARGYAGRCQSHNCRRTIEQGQRMTMWGGYFWHAACLSDEAYRRMASVRDICPEIFDDVPVLEYKRLPLDQSSTNGNLGGAVETWHGIATGEKS